MISEAGKRMEIESDPNQRLGALPKCDKLFCWKHSLTLSPTPLFKKLIPLMGLPNSDRVKSWKQRNRSLPHCDF